MIKNNIQFTQLESSDGKVIRNKNDKTIFSKKVFLSINDSEENWEEVDEIIAAKEKEELEKYKSKKREELEKELEYRNNKYFE